MPKRKRHDTPQQPDTSPNPKFCPVTCLDKHRLPIGHGAEVYYLPDFLPPAEAQTWLHQLSALDTWQNPTLKVYGHSVTQSRAVAVYATEPASMRYSGAEIPAHSFPPAVQRMRERVQEALGVQFNYVMLNRYDHGSVYIGRHSDTRDNLVIASVSVGAPRTFVLTPRRPPKRRGGKVSEEGLEGRQQFKLSLANGSILVMQGETQDFWKHEIPREPTVKEPRISLTFRQFSR